jgi:hypothetical protein
MVPPRDFILAGAAALLLTFVAMALQAPWPGAWGFAAVAAWAALRLVVDRLSGERVTEPKHIAQMLLGGGVVFLLTLLAP